MGKHFQKESRAVKSEFTGKTSRRFRAMTGVAMAICAIGTAGLGSFATVLAQDAVVTSQVIDGDTLYSVSAPSTDVDLLLREAGVVLDDEDVVVREDNADGTTVTVKRKLTAEINVDGETIVAEGYTGDTVGQLIEKAGIALEDTDAVTPSVSTQVWEDTDVTISEMKSVYIVDNNVARHYMVPTGTVSKAVKAAGIKLGPDDYVSDGKQAVTDGMIIGVNRVTYETVKKTETVDYAVKEKETDSLYVGETEVKTQGQEGKKTVTYKRILVNGKVTDTEKVKENVTKEAVDKVVLVGTKEKKAAVNKTSTAAAASSGNTFVDASGNVVEYQGMLSGTCTAYTGDGTTSTGMTPSVGVVAVNPNQIPYGTKLYITSPDGSIVYGYAVAGDTGGAMMAGEAMIDLYMNSEQECYNFGRRTMNIYILA